MAASEWRLKDANVHTGHAHKTYSAADLVKHCLGFLAIPRSDEHHPEQWTKSRVAARDKLGRWYADWVADPADPLDAANQAPVLEAVKLISEVFFDGMNDNVNLLWGSVTWEPTEIDGFAEPIETGAYTTCNKAGQVTIYFNPPVRENESRQVFRERLFNSLLHESVHAYLYGHACLFPACQCWPKSQQLVGEDGHGEAFFMVAFRVTAFWAEHFSELPGKDLNVLLNLTRYYAITGISLTPEQIAKAPCADDVKQRLTLFRARTEEVNRCINDLIDRHAGQRRNDPKFIEEANSQFKGTRTKLVEDETQWGVEVDELPNLPPLFKDDIWCT